MLSSPRSTGGLSPAPVSWHCPAVDDLAAVPTDTYLGRAPRPVGAFAVEPVGGSAGVRSTDESLTREKVTDGRVEAVTLNRAFVTTMLVAPRTTNATIPASSCTNGRSNAFPSFRAGRLTREHPDAANSYVGRVRGGPRKPPAGGRRSSAAG